jgi:hypothetical protein
MLDVVGELRVQKRTRVRAGDGEQTVAGETRALHRKMRDQEFGARVVIIRIPRIQVSTEVITTLDRNSAFYRVLI